MATRTENNNGFSFMTHPSHSHSLDLPGTASPVSETASSSNSSSSDFFTRQRATSDAEHRGNGADSKEPWLSEQHNLSAWLGESAVSPQMSSRRLASHKQQRFVQEYPETDYDASRPKRNRRRSTTNDTEHSVDSSKSGGGSDKKVNLYKTELCRSWEETGTCRYGNKCQFAHSESELRNVVRHPKYKTEVCKTFWEQGWCPYGKRCCFIHNEDVKDIVGSRSEPTTPTKAKHPALKSPRKTPGHGARSGFEDRNNLPPIHNHAPVIPPELPDLNDHQAIADAYFGGKLNYVPLTHASSEPTTPIKRAGVSSPVNASARYPGGHDIKRIWESTDASLTGSAVGLNQQDLDSDEVYFRRRTRTQHTPEYHPSEAMQSRLRKTRSVTLEPMDIGQLSQSLMGLNMHGHAHGGLSPHASRLSYGGNSSYPTAANTPTGMQSPVHPLSSSFDHQRSQSWLENQDSNGSFAVPASLPSFNKTPIPSPIRSGPSTPRVSRGLNINTTLANSAFGPKDSFLPSPASVSDPFSPHSAFSPWVQTPSARSGLASTPTSPGKWNLVPKAEETEVAKKVDAKNGDSQQGYSYF